MDDRPRSGVTCGGLAPAGSYETSVWAAVVMRVETARFVTAVEAAAFFVGLAPGGNYETVVWVVVFMRVETAGSMLR